MANIRHSSNALSEPDSAIELTLEDSEKLKINHYNSTSEPAHVRENKNERVENHNYQYVNIVKFDSFEKQRVNLDKRTLHHSIISMKDNSYYMLIEDLEHLNSPKFNSLHRYRFSTDMHDKKNNTMEYQLVSPLLKIYLNKFMKKLLLIKRKEAKLLNRKSNGAINLSPSHIHRITQFPDKNNLKRLENSRLIYINKKKELLPSKNSIIYETPKKINRNFNRTQEIIKEKLRNVEIMKKIMILKEKNQRINPKRNESYKHNLKNLHSQKSSIYQTKRELYKKKALSKKLKNKNFNFNFSFNRKYAEKYNTHRNTHKDSAYSNLNLNLNQDNYRRASKIHDSTYSSPGMKHFSSKKSNQNSSEKKRTWEENILSNTYSKLFINTYMTRQLNRNDNEVNFSLNQKSENISPEKISSIRNSKNLASSKIKQDIISDQQNEDKDLKFNSTNENMLTLSNGNELNIAYESQKPNHNMSLLQLEKEINQMKSLELSFKNVNDLSVKIRPSIFKDTTIGIPDSQNLEELKIHDLNNKDLINDRKNSRKKELYQFQNPQLINKNNIFEEHRHNIPNEIIKKIQKVTVGKGYFYY